MTKDEAIKALRDKSSVIMIHYPSVVERCDIEYERITAVTLRMGRNGKEFFEVELKDKKANSVTITRPENVYLKGVEPPSKPVSGTNGTLRHKYGEYKNVLLSNEEMDKLKVDLPDTYEKLIEDLSTYMVTSGKGYKNHYVVIKTWARREDEEKNHSDKTTVRRGKFNNYNDTNKPDYADFGEQILRDMLESSG